MIPADTQGNGKPTWFLLLREFGFPTLVAAAALFGCWKLNEQARADRKEDLTAHYQALRELAKEMHCCKSLAGRAVQDALPAHFQGDQ